MSEKIIIIKVLSSKAKQIIERVNESYEFSEHRYYNSTPVDQDNIRSLDKETHQVVFIQYSIPQSGNGYQADVIYTGKGTKAEYNKKPSIIYLIDAKIEHRLVIENFISFIGLDFTDDFSVGSYIYIETSEDLMDQLKFIMLPLYKPKTESTHDYQELEEEKNLSPLSQRNQYCIRQYNILPSQEGRSEFQRDYERIVHSRSFRRIVDKAQVFSSSKGDHYRTRMTHTLIVSQIARGIAKSLKMNMFLTEAISLGHDLGHTPFGHQGERTIDDILKGKDDLISCSTDKKNPFGGFKHNYQALRVLTHLEEEYIDFPGLDLSYQALEGIWKHTKINNKNCSDCKKTNCSKCFDLKEFASFDVSNLYPDRKYSSTIEGQIVAISDEIAQRGHDLDDALSAKIITQQDINKYIEIKKASPLECKVNEIDELLSTAKSNNRSFINESGIKQSRIVSAILHYLITDVIEESEKRIKEYSYEKFLSNAYRVDEELVKFSTEGKALCDYLERIISKKVITSTEVTYFDNKAQMIVLALFKAYYNNPMLLHEGTLKRINVDFRELTKNTISLVDGDPILLKSEWAKIIHEYSEDDTTLKNEYWMKRKILVRNIADFISGMTDSYALNEYKKIYQ